MQDFYFWTDKKHGSNPYLGTFRKDKTIDWKTRHEVHIMALSVGSKLMELGFPQGSRIGVYSENRLEAAVFLEAAQIYGYVIIFSFDAEMESYPGYVYDHSDCSVLYVSPHKLKLFEKIDPARMKSLKFVIVEKFPNLEKEKYEYLRPIKLLHLSEFIGRTGNFAAPPQVLPNHINTICYSSGTAGAPKGVIISHKAMLYGVYNILCSLDVTDHIIHISFLPIAHILERLTLAVINFRGGRIAFAHKGVRKMMKDTRIAHATGGPNIPKIIEVIEQEIFKKVPNFLLKGALKFQRFCSYFGFRSRLTDLLLFNKIQKAFGGGLEWFAVAGDVLSPETHRNVQDILNIQIIPIYGLSELSGAVGISDKRDICPGTVGCLAPGFEVKFGERDEIFIKGPTLFDGYWKNPETTAQVMHNGWFRSGDKGSFDKDGNLIVIGRAYNSFEYKPGCELALPFIGFVYKQSSYLTDIYLEYIQEAKSFIAILVVPKDIISYALNDVLDEPLTDDESYLHAANSETFLDWVRPALRAFARNNDLGNIPYIGAVRNVITPFQDTPGLLTQTGKQRIHKFKEMFANELEEMRNEVIKRRKEKNLKDDELEYSSEGYESYDEDEEEEEAESDY
ncbi:AMP-binding enzyme family protein [Tritrichomonas foetus]|uniref:AMP-binding enzyme family protein n=1 Tax=Tritrichomonas foetus TaxID=1144522 RepID=A0A1J4K0P0_9EUKA|nr:AMP-binding enzyme family protein [Tritrichomonas foetus]|eukprot:OHT04943.1 AMP-binding enzyme family protein [Tritrichomonas foetus]